MNLTQRPKDRRNSRKRPARIATPSVAGVDAKLAKNRSLVGRGYQIFPHAKRLLNNQVASVNVNTAMMAMGQVLFRISTGGMSFRNTPLITTMM